MSVRVTQVRSTIGVQRQHRGTLRALGLGRIGKTRLHDDSPTLRGMLRQVDYLIRVEENEA